MEAKSEFAIIQIWEFSECLGKKLDLMCLTHALQWPSFYTDLFLFGLVWFLFYSLEHILGHFERGQLT